MDGNGQAPPAQTISFAAVARKILWGSLALAPVTLLVDSPGPPDRDTALFVLAAAALVPLAWLIGEATEHAAHHTGPGIGGFLNATFGNAPELIIALLAVSEGLMEVVRGSLTGSVVSNLLLVLGLSLVAGGRGRVDRTSTFVSLGLVALATLMLLIPSVPGWTGDHERHSIAVISVPVSIVLLVIYAGVTWVFAAASPADARGRRSRRDAAWSLKVSLESSRSPPSSPRSSRRSSSTPWRRSPSRPAYPISSSPP